MGRRLVGRWGGRRRLLALIMVALTLTGCGVDSTRSLWGSRWVERKAPAHGRFWHGAGRGMEVTSKMLLTPETAVIDVITDKQVLTVVAIVGVIALVVVVAAVISKNDNGNCSGSTIPDCGGWGGGSGGGASGAGSGGGGGWVAGRGKRGRQ